MGPFFGPPISQGTVLLDMGFSLVQKINERNRDVTPTQSV